MEILLQSLSIQTFSVFCILHGRRKFLSYMGSSIPSKTFLKLLILLLEAKCKNTSFSTLKSSFFKFFSW